MSKYLLFKLGAFGDLSFFLPAVQQIHAHDPNAVITWVVSQAYGQLIRQIPRVQRVIEIDEISLFHGTLWARFTEVFKLWMRLDGFYDQIWVGHRTPVALLLLRFRVFGRFFQVVRKPSPWLRLFRTEVGVKPLSLHETYAFKRLAERALQKTIPEVDWKADYSWVPSTPLRPQTPYITVHLGGGQNGRTEFLLKKWPYWARFLEKLVATTRATVVLVGGKTEFGLAQEILEKFQSEFKIVSRVGQTDFLQLLAIIQGSQHLIGVDSGPLHFADAMGIPCTGLYGPTSLISWGLLNPQSRALSQHLPCSPCYRDSGQFSSCPYDVKCMRDLSVEAVLKSCLKMGPTQVVDKERWAASSSTNLREV